MVNKKTPNVLLIVSLYLFNQLNHFSMSHLKKKKITPQMLKQQEAENKKRFFQKVANFFAAIDQPELYAMLSRSSLERLYLTRISPPIVKFDASIKIQPAEVKKVRDILYENLKLFPVEFNNKTLNLNCYEYITTGFTIYLILLSHQSKHYPESELIGERIDPMIHELYSNRNIWDTLLLFDISLSSQMNKLNGSMYSMTYDWSIVNTTHVATVLQFHEIKAQKKEMVIDGILRPVYRVGWALSGQFCPTFIDRKKLRLNAKDYPQEIEIFIQNHALHRLCERVDKILESELHIFVNNAFINQNQIIVQGNKYLIELKIHNCYKVGYLVATMVKDKLVIRTFLLLTQMGTPEEKKLRQLTGLNRYDIEFLNLNKFSSFFDSTLYTDPKMKALFEEAGFKPIMDCVENYDLITERQSKLTDRLHKLLAPNEEEPNWHEVAETFDEQMETASMEQQLAEQE
jgi:hypothetical protein